MRGLANLRPHTRPRAVGRCVCFPFPLRLIHLHEKRFRATSYYTATEYVCSLGRAAFKGWKSPKGVLLLTQLRDRMECFHSIPNRMECWKHKGAASSCMRHLLPCGVLATCILISVARLNASSTCDFVALACDESADRWPTTARPT